MGDTVGGWCLACIQLSVIGSRCFLRGRCRVEVGIFPH